MVTDRSTGVQAAEFRHSIEEGTIPINSIHLKIVFILLKGFSKGNRSRRYFLILHVHTVQKIDVFLCVLVRSTIESNVLGSERRRFLSEWLLWVSGKISFVFVFRRRLRRHPFSDAVRSQGPNDGSLLNEAVSSDGFCRNRNFREHLRDPFKKEFRFHTFTIVEIRNTFFRHSVKSKLTHFFNESLNEGMRLNIFKVF